MALLLPDKRVRFSPFVTYLGEEQPPPEMEESLHLDGSTALIGRRRSGSHNGMNKQRLSLDLQELLLLEKPSSSLTIGDGSSGGFSFGSFGAANGGSDILNFSLSGSIREEEEEDATEDGRLLLNMKGPSKNLIESDSSFPDLGPLSLEDVPGMDGSSQEVTLTPVRAS